MASDMRELHGQGAFVATQAEILRQDLEQRLQRAGAGGFVADSADTDEYCRGLQNALAEASVLRNMMRRAENV